MFCSLTKKVKIFCRDASKDSRGHRLYREGHPMNRLVAVFLFAMLTCSLAFSASAHSSNEAYVYLDVGTDSLDGLLEFRLADLDTLFHFDQDTDGEATPAEFVANQAEIYAFASQQLAFEVGGAAVAIQIESHSFLPTGMGTFVTMNFTTDWHAALPDAINVRFVGETVAGSGIERALLIMRNNAKTGLVGNVAIPALIFDPGVHVLELSLTGESLLSRFWLFLTSGMKHIFSGYDHIAFVIALLLPSVLVRAKFGSAKPVQGLRQGLTTMLKVVTVFTVAHSITLSLAALDLLTYWAEMIELLIAVSIFIVAMQNIFGRTANWVYLVVFGLGLLHGLGFASVLAPYGSYQSELWLSLLGFNLGVEVGQALIVLALFPVLFVLRKWSHYALVINAGGSVVLALIALYWMMNRVINVLATWP
jgi:hypothetical protein